ncbi:MAG: glucose-1-phosphate cytidylyltransferase [Endomicrobium sp.]|jgi:glucose-1-phosphate cytidylyltransferase|nr:glucose-1-phosphate cytidylyltransferase [Endomicrobium sp.]
MKVVILAGGYGTRISEESILKPKPMIEIGELPVLCHIMKYYSAFGFSEFIICCGYKGYLIKEYFSNYFLHNSDITFDFSNDNKMTVHNNAAEPWKVTLVDTGLNTMTGGRLKRIKKYLDGERFMMTYGDGVCDLDIKELIEFHNISKKIATLTAIQPGGRFGVINLDDTKNFITSFSEKSKEDGGWINGGFMVLEPEIFDYIESDSTIFEKEPLETLAMQKQLCAFKHTGFWQCMDTQRDKIALEKLWTENQAPWKIW